ncbi:MAG: hypothetical protein K0Q49_365 [Haloplasmataceae bacterium]|jgi:predicted PurR-regulated permease PerM|nr:hypothetical protein [Haloplasmataceae bacterium]
MKKLNLNFLYILSFILLSLVILILSNVAFPIIFNLMMNIIYLLTPFIIGFFFAFLLHTLVDKIEEQGINRALSVLLVFLLFLIIFVYLISSLIPIIAGQVSQLKNQIPEIYHSVEVFLNDFWNRFDFIPNEYHFSLGDIEHWTIDKLFNGNLSANNLLGILDSFATIILAPIITFYFLNDYNNLKKRLVRFLKRNHMRFTFNFLKEVDVNFGQYFRGLILVMNLMTLASALGFYLVGLDYPLLFGFIVGYTNVIPYFGPYIGGIPAVLFALSQDWKIAIFTLLTIVGVQLIESNIVTPYVQSKSIDAHPLLILLSFIVFGKYFGILGMIFSVPLLAVILLILRYIRIYIRLKRCKKFQMHIEKEVSI